MRRDATEIRVKWLGSHYNGTLHAKGNTLLANSPVTILKTIQWLLPKPVERQDKGNALVKACHAHSYWSQTATAVRKGKPKSKIISLMFTAMLQTLFMVHLTVY
jgi:hypothetical protein